METLTDSKSVYQPPRIEVIDMEVETTVMAGSVSSSTKKPGYEYIEGEW